MHPIEFTIPSDYRREQRTNYVRHSYRLREMLNAMIPERGGIYLFTHLPTGETYVGASENLRKRIKAHLCSCPKNLGFTPRVTQFIAEHGPTEFRVSILEFSSGWIMAAREREWFDRLQPTLNDIPPGTRRRFLNWDPIALGA